MVSRESFKDKLFEMAEERSVRRIGGFLEGGWITTNHTLRVGAIWWHEASSEGRKRGIRADVLVAGGTKKSSDMISIEGLAASYHAMQEGSCAEVWVPTSPKWMELGTSSGLESLQVYDAQDKTERLDLSMRGERARRRAQGILAGGIVLLRIANQPTFGGLPLAGFIEVPPARQPIAGHPQESN